MMRASVGSFHGETHLKNLRKGMRLSLAMAWSRRGALEKERERDREIAGGRGEWEKSGKEGELKRRRKEGKIKDVHIFLCHC